MKFDKALDYFNFNEGVLETISDLIRDVLNILFGNINKEMGKDLTEKVKEDKVESVNIVIKNFNNQMPKVELNKTYNSKTTPFMDVYINLLGVSKEDKELVKDGTPEKIKFTIIGYGKRKINPKVGKKASTDFNYSVVGVSTLSNNDIKEYVQNIFDNTFNSDKSKNVGIQIKVSEITGNLGVVDVVFDKNIYKPKEEVEATEALTKNYILPKTNSTTLPSITFKIAEIQGYPSKLYFKFNFNSDVLDQQNKPVITKNEAFKKAKDITQPKIVVLNNVLSTLTKDVNDSVNKSKDNKYYLNSLKIHMESSGNLVVSNGYVMVDVNWVKK